jgi:hypothetical protein
MADNTHKRRDQTAILLDTQKMVVVVSRNDRKKLSHSEEIASFVSQFLLKKSQVRKILLCNMSNKYLVLRIHTGIFKLAQLNAVMPATLRMHFTFSILYRN